MEFDRPWMKWLWVCILLLLTSSDVTSMLSFCRTDLLTVGLFFLCTRTAGNFAWDLMCSKCSVIVSGRVCNGAARGSSPVCGF